MSGSRTACRTIQNTVDSARIEFDSGRDRDHPANLWGPERHDSETPPRARPPGSISLVHAKADIRAGTLVGGERQAGAERPFDRVDA